MTTLDEGFLRKWAVLAMVLLAIIVIVGVLPGHVQTILSEKLLSLKSSTWGFVALALVCIPAVMIVLGFYALMLIECGFAKKLRYQAAWLLFMFLIPPLSAFVYYYHTRLSKHISV